MLSFARGRYLLVAPLLIAAGIMGCGEAPPKRVAVNGSVKLDGKPVEQGTITFVPEDGSADMGAGAEIKAGEYNLAADTGPTNGKFRVEIHWSRPTGKKVPVGSPAPPGTMMDEVKEAIPAKYNAQSKLEREISSDENTLDFDLDS